MISTYTERETLIAMQCGECGVWFGMPQSLHDKKVQSNGSFFCINGHSRMFVGETEAQRLKKQLEREQTWATDAVKRLSAQRDLAERRAAAFKGQTTKLKKRIGNGVCPCCSRHFVNVERHVKGQHPEFVAEERAAEAKGQLAD